MAVWNMRKLFIIMDVIMNLRSMARREMFSIERSTIALIDGGRYENEGLC